MPSTPSRRGPWSPGEDNRLLSLIEDHGPTNWVRISQMLSTRTPKQCRERYHQNLKPTLNHSPITDQEGLHIEQLVATYGKKWAEIARHLNGRSDNAVKNWWNAGANRRRRESIASPKLGPSSAPSSVPNGLSLYTDNGTPPLQPIGNMYPHHQQLSTSFPMQNGPAHQHHLEHPLPTIPGANHPPSHHIQQQLGVPFPQRSPPQPQQNYPHIPPQASPQDPSQGPSQGAPLFNPGYSMGPGSSQTSQLNAPLPSMHHGPPYPPAASAPTANLSLSNQSPSRSSNGPFDLQAFHDHQPPPHPFRHRVSLPNIHAAAASQYQSSPLGNRPSSGPSGSSVVFNSAYTTDSSGFRKSSAAQVSTNVDPHQQPQDPAGQESHQSSQIPLPPIQGSPDHRFQRRTSRSASVFLYSSIRNRAAAAPYSSNPDDLSFSRRFSTTTTLSNGYKSRTNSIDGGVSSASDNEDPLSAASASHSLSKYSLGSASNSRRNSYIVPDHHPQQHTPTLPPLSSSSNSPPPPTLLTLPAATALASVSNQFNQAAPEYPSQSFTPPPAKPNGFNGFNNPFAKRHSISGYVPNNQSKLATPLSPINSSNDTHNEEPMRSVDNDRAENSRPTSEVLESWGRSNSTSSARRSSSVSSHGHLPNKDMDVDMDAPEVAPMKAFHPINNKISISNLLS